jgi:hypothetical protein
MPGSMASMFKRLWILTIHSLFCHSLQGITAFRVSSIAIGVGE